MFIISWNFKKVNLISKKQKNIIDNREGMLYDKFRKTKMSTKKQKNGL